MSTEATRTLYTAKAVATGGRDGRVATVRGYPDHVVKPPAELGGPADADPTATNPEELFALGYAACYLSALQHIARRQKISAKAFRMGITVRLVTVEDGFGLAVDLDGELPGVAAAKAAELMHAAHETCPYSKATRGNIDVRLAVGGVPV
jgi:lipoyl-dependent peroxiredoxin